MSSDRVKPVMFFLDHGDTVEDIPYEDGFEYDADESLVFSAEGWMSGDALYIEMVGCSVCFNLDALLANALAEIDSDDNEGTKEEDREDLLSVLKKYIQLLEK